MVKDGKRPHAKCGTIFAAWESGVTSKAKPKNRHRANPDGDHSAWFRLFARNAANASGHSISFLAAAALIVGWLVTGPFFHFSDTWQLVINTTTTIITFLMVFVIQNTQNRDSAAMQVKLDELIRVTQAAHNHLLNVEDLSDEELATLKKQYGTLSRKAEALLRSGQSDVGCPELMIPRRAQVPRYKPGRAGSTAAPSRIGSVRQANTYSNGKTRPANPHSEASNSRDFRRPVSAIHKSATEPCQKK